MGVFKVAKGKHFFPQFGEISNQLLPRSGED